MDSITQIKNNLISRIRASKDLNFLKALQTIFDTSEQALYQLSPEQQNSIEAGRADIAEGYSIENEKLTTEMREWLEKQ